MLKALILLVISLNVFAVAEEHATYSLQRFDNKIVATIDHDKGWHTYWKNPGDSGLPSAFKFSKDGKPLTPKAFEWPAPDRHIEEGDILTIGYVDRQHFFFENIPGDFKIRMEVLICKDVCIPGEADLFIKGNEDFKSSRNISKYSESDLRKAFEALPLDAPTPPELEYYLTRVKDKNLLTLHYSLKGVKNPKLPHELLFLTPFPRPPFGYKRETLYVQNDVLYGKTEIEWDGEYQEPAIDLPTNGSFAQPYELKFLYNAPGSHDVNIVTLKIKDFSNATPSLDEFYKKLQPYDGQGKTAALESTEDQNIFKFLLFAFLGGLILNLMPCVLPVISLKLFGLIKHKDYSQKRLLAHNISYTFGVVSTFLILALIIAGLKATGEEVGWGFQLQSPAFILIMMMVLFVMSLNMFGLFEFNTPFGNKIGGTKTEESFLGDFLGGVLTTILSTPCSAPFLGTALTFAFTTSYLMIFVMFTFIGLGLAFPFMLTAFFPRTLSFLPKPGMWMEKLKYFLGLSLLVTVIWLYDVFVNLVDFDFMSMKLNVLFALWFFAFFFAQKISKNRFLKAFFIVLPLILTGITIDGLEVKKTVDIAETQGSPFKPWSEEGMAQEKGKFIFVDFTAAWCLTCKVNKKLVIETKGFEELQKKHDLVLMRADWTRRDNNITQFLKRFNIFGVPAYFIQKPDGSVVSLGETITLHKIEKHIVP
jgi:thiol:disulfide interchange protein DsbD